MIWGKKGTSPARSPQHPDSTQDPAVAEAAAPAAAPDRAALSTLADLVETMGDLLSDLGDTKAGEIQHLAAQWAVHVRTGRHLGEGATSTGHDWAGIQKFCSLARKEEQTRALRTVTDLREVLESVLDGIARSIAQDRAADDEVSGALGDLGEVAKQSSLDDLREAASQTVSVVSSAIRDRKNRQEAQVNALDASLKAMKGELSEAQEQVMRDGLTRLYNRRAFDQKLQEVGQNKRAEAASNCLIMVDGDHFKSVNDTYGHQAGDAVLVSMAQTLLRTFARAEDFVARYGGEEFAVIIKVDSDKSAHAMAQNALKAIRDMEVKHGDETIRLTASLGLSMLKPGESPQAWLERADQALYSAKEGGRNRCVLSQ